MRYLFILILISCNCFSEPIRELNDSVALSIGRIQMYQDRVTRYEEGRVSLGHYYLPEFIQSEYESSIEQLSTQEKVDFIWGIISFAKFGEYGTTAMAELIINCCKDEFLASANAFIIKADNALLSRSYVDESMLHKARFFVRAVQ